MGLFNKKKIVYTEKTVMLLDVQGNPRFKGSVYSLPIREDVIRLKSIEFFNDPEPCAIHRNAVYFRLCTEVEEYMEKYGQDTISLASLPEQLRSYLNC